jgi:hypothetical protein
LETTESEGLTLMAGWNANFLEPMNVAKDSGRLGSAPKLSRLHSWKRATHRCLAPRRTARPGWHGPARGGPRGGRAGPGSFRWSHSYPRLGAPAGGLVGPWPVVAYFAAGGSVPVLRHR